MTASEDGVTLEAAMRSDRGLVRPNNQDACATHTERGLFVLSDGMGGHSGGAVASRIVVEALPALLDRAPGRPMEAPDVAPTLSRAVAALSEQLRREGASHLELAEMGATLVALIVRGGVAHVLHIGDSRAYLLRGGHLERLTEDHSVVAALVRLGEITQADAVGHPQANRLTRYVGMDGDADPDVRSFALADADRLLLCSDGLTGMLSDERIEEILCSRLGVEEVCEELVAEANAAGGRDNVSVVVVDVHRSLQPAAQVPEAPGG